MQPIEKFLSCDWGTSTFRLKLIDIKNLTTIAEESSKQGIANTFELWKQSGQKEENRLQFYLIIIKNHIKALEQKTGVSLNDVPLVISGMASSTIGIIDLPYKELPFSIDGSDIQVQTIEATSNFKHKIVIISGAKTDNDVMRGEETKLIGCIINSNSEEEETVILPGTHPKHATIKNGKVIAFVTYMTGEFFDLLSKKSVLSVSVEEGKGFEDESNRQSFEKGVKDSIQSNLLHSSFLVRTNHLFNQFTKQQNYYYLSGLLIGTELKEYKNNGSLTITILSNNTLKPYYETAFQVLGISYENFLNTHNADEALIKGQFKILQHLNSWQ